MRDTYTIPEDEGLPDQVLVEGLNISHDGRLDPSIRVEV